MIEYETLKNFGIEKQAIEECANPETVQKMLKGDFKKENLPTYCKLKLDSVDGVNVMIDKGLIVEEIEEKKEDYEINAIKQHKARPS